MKSKSPFDSGNWSEHTGLPHEQDETNFLEHLTLQDPNKNFLRRHLYDEVAKEFEIPTAAQEALGPGSNTPQFATGMSRIISNALVGERHANKPFLKRIAFSVYQHITGNGELDVAIREMIRSRRTVKTPKRLVNEARVSVRILKSLNPPHDPETIMCELGGRVWSDDVIEAAIKLEFPNI